MADNKGSDSKPNEDSAGAARASSPTKASGATTEKPSGTGPVKPPVLDLKARETSAEKSDTKPVSPTGPVPPKEPSDAATKVPPTPPNPTLTPPAPPTRSSHALGAGLVGGAVGLAAAYGLAWFGLWPSTPIVLPTPEVDPRIAQFATAIPELETVTQTTQSELSTLNQRIVALESVEPASATTATAAPVDLSGVEGEIAALTARMDALAATPAAPLDTGDFNDLRSALAALTARLDEVSARVGTAEASLRTLDTTLSQTTATIAEQPSDIGAVLQLPLILSGFETAFATGRPYATELSALRAALPDAPIPTSIANSAETGITRPDVIASRFAVVLPNMLAGRPANPDAEWTAGLADWFASSIALRPTGEIPGDTPEAVMSRLEGAIARRDFTDAETLLSSLPPAMIAAGEDVPALIASQAEAASFLETLRASALTGGAAQ